jgi:Stress responsive A/B Barrel Domain
MKWFRTNNRVHLGAGAALAMCLFLPGCGTMPAPAPTVTHVILIWMKHPHRSTDRAKLRRAAYSLRMMPGVLRVEAGRTVPALPPGLDRSFDLGVVITFRDQAALQRYEKDPRHLEAMRRYLRPLVRRYEVYNFSSR